MTNNLQFDLDLNSAKPPVIHGRDGISQKAAGAGPCFALHLVHAACCTAGSIELNGKTYHVQGTSWMDHEFFSESLDSSESGWDWLSLQLDDNTELMLYRLRHKDGSVDPYSSGTYVDAQGNAVSVVEGFHDDAGRRDLDQPGRRRDVSDPVARQVPGLGLEMEMTTPLREPGVYGNDSGRATGKARSTSRDTRSGSAAWRRAIWK